MSKVGKAGAALLEPELLSPRESIFSLGGKQASFRRNRFALIRKFHADKSFAYNHTSGNNLASVYPSCSERIFVSRRAEPPHTKKRVKPTFKAIAARILKHGSLYLVQRSS